MVVEGATVVTYAVLDAITASAESVVLQIEKLKSSMNVFDKLADL